MTSKRHQQQPSTNFIRLFFFTNGYQAQPGYWFPPNIYQGFGWIFSQVGPGISTTVLKWNRFWGRTSKRHQHQPSTNFIRLFFLQIWLSAPPGYQYWFPPNIYQGFGWIFLTLGPGISTTVLKWNRFWDHTSKRHQHQPSTNFIRLFVYKLLSAPPGYQYWFPPNIHKGFSWIFFK